jgi:hypothetical protein
MNLKSVHNALNGNYKGVFFMDLLPCSLVVRSLQNSGTYLPGYVVLSRVTVECTSFVFSSPQDIYSINPIVCFHLVLSYGGALLKQL